MNPQRTSGRRLAACVSAATLALVLAALPVSSALAAPASPDGPLTGQISALWQRVSGWIGIAPERDRPREPGRVAGFLLVSEPDPAATTQRDDVSAGHLRAEGEDGCKIDPSG